MSRIEPTRTAAFKFLERPPSEKPGLERATIQKIERFVASSLAAKTVTPSTANETKAHERYNSK